MIAIAVSSTTAFTSESTGLNPTEQTLLFMAQSGISEFHRPFHTLPGIRIKLIWRAAYWRF